MDKNDPRMDDVVFTDGTTRREFLAQRDARAAVDGLFVRRLSDVDLDTLDLDEFVVLCWDDDRSAKIEVEQYVEYDSENELHWVRLVDGREIGVWGSDLTVEPRMDQGDA